MTNTEIAFYSFKQFGYSLLHIGGNGDSVEVFSLFSMYLKKLLNTSKTKVFLTISCNHMYLDMGRDNDDDYDGESGNEDYYD